jgi:hypothetical protein
MTEAKAKARWNLAQWVVIAVRAISLYGAFMPHPAPPVAPAGATAEIHYAPDENLEPIDVAEIDRVRKTIDISAYVLTEDAIIDAFARGPAWRRPQDRARSRDWRNGRATTILPPGLGETPEGIQNPDQGGRRRADAPERLLRRRAGAARRLGEFLAVGRDATGQRPRHCARQRGSR